jgi:hypothetical protein
MIRRGFLAVDPALLSWVLGTYKTTPGVLMSATGNAWQWRGVEGAQCSTTFLQAAAVLRRGLLEKGALVGECAPRRFRAQAAQARRQAGVCSPLDRRRSAVSKMRASQRRRGSSSSSRSDIEHWTDPVTEGERVAIAGNLFFRH